MVVQIIILQARHTVNIPAELTRFQHAGTSFGRAYDGKDSPSPPPFPPGGVAGQAQSPPPPPSPPGATDAVLGVSVGPASVCSTVEGEKLQIVLWLISIPSDTNCAKLHVSELDVPSGGVAGQAQSPPPPASTSGEALHRVHAVSLLLCTAMVLCTCTGLVDAAGYADGSCKLSAADGAHQAWLACVVHSCDSCSVQPHAYAGRSSYWMSPPPPSQSSDKSPPPSGSDSSPPQSPSYGAASPPPSGTQGQAEHDLTQAAAVPCMRPQMSRNWQCRLITSACKAPPGTCRP